LDFLACALDEEAVNLIAAMDVTPIHSEEIFTLTDVDAGFS